MAGDTERESAVEDTTGLKLEKAGRDGRGLGGEGLVGVVGHVQRLRCGTAGSAGHVLSLSGQAVSLRGGGRKQMVRAVTRKQTK